MKTKRKALLSALFILKSKIHVKPNPNAYAETIG
jgi:hypothetical protein